MPTEMLYLIIAGGGLLVGLLLGVLIAKGMAGRIAGELRSDLQRLDSKLAKASDEIRDLGKDVDAGFQNATGRLREATDLQQMTRESTLTAMAKLEKSMATDLAAHQNDALRTQSELFAAFRQDVGTRLDKLSETNAAQLTQMRETVDTKLQSALDEKLQTSFSAVVDQLTKVQEGIGTMQSLASDVGGLKQVLSNVKTRGMLGEIQLGAILQEVLSPEQYAENIVTVKGSQNPVEYAVKLPGQSEDGFVYLPIDSKFPMDTYQALLDAYDAAEAGADKASVQSAWKQLATRLKQEAKDIHEKYVHPPETTEFAVLFLPTEGLYAEAVRRGMIEMLQRDYRVMIAGPTTMAALLNSLQMGFKTLAIQKSSSEVWHVLSNVKTEFAKFEDALNQAQKRLRQADEDIDRLVGTRTRMINRRLAQITAASDGALGGEQGDLAMPERMLGVLDAAPEEP